MGMSETIGVTDPASIGARPDWTIDQNWQNYTPEEHQVWTTLYERQMRILPGRACDDFFEGLKLLNLNDGGIPDLEKLNKTLFDLTGWTVVCVPGLVPDDVFHTHLANRRFPAGQFIRNADQLDYLQEPDIFHDVFGHVPLLALPVYADYMQAFGQGGLRALKRGTQQLGQLARLYWYTVEFGLIETPKGLRIFGAGIVSSRTESIFALEDPSPNRLGFDLERIMRSKYRIDDFQQNYFVIPSFEDLRQATLRDFMPVYDHMEHMPEIEIETILPSDTVFTVGDHTYARAGGRYTKTVPASLAGSAPSR